MLARKIPRLLLPALLVYSVILYRAAHQAATLDEADAFLNFSTGNLDMSFYPSSGNHVLNSLLDRFITQAFGLSQLTFRGAAMLGAAIYLAAAASIASRLPKVQYLAFAMLTLNPFVLDYLTASRGYALALGLLAASVAMAFKIIEDKPPVGRTAIYCTLISVCLGLAFTANFSFAFAIICTGAAFLLTLILVRTPFKQWIGFAAATSIPGSVVAYAIVGQTLRDYPRAQLYYGADTWAQSFTEMLDAMFPRENLSFPAVNPVLSIAHYVGGFLILIPIAIAVWGAVRTTSWALRFIWLALVFTLSAHTLAHRVNNLLLPLDRTSLFISFFLSVLAIYGAASSRIAKAALYASLVIFVLGFRTNYFRIWDFDLDIDRGFAKYVEYSKSHPIATAGCTWRYGGAYNLYRRALNGVATLPQCDYIDQDNPPPRSVYFIHVPGQAEFIEKAKLQIVYQGPVSGLVVGVAPASQ
jgi:hypothetical protein